MFLAHIAEDGREEAVEDHLCAVAERAADFAARFGSEGWAYNMGVLHDIGKYTDAFQRRIKENGPRVDHSTAGASIMADSGDLGALLAYAIAGHHAGLPDGCPTGENIQRETQDSTLTKRLERFRAENSSGATWLNRAPFKRLGLRGSPGTPTPLVGAQKSGGYGAGFWVRMMFSCLVDADFLATEEFMQGHERKNLPSASAAELRDTLEDRLSMFYPPRTPLNELRCRILDDCRAAATGQPGFYALTVPTGGGKTLGSLRFALNQAALSGHLGAKVIYAVPYTSIIEQNADVIRGMIGREQVLEHHSGFDFDSVDEKPEGQEHVVAHNRERPTGLGDALRLAAENWDAPVVVTTNVQLFESLHSNRTSKCRKLHNLAKSVIVLDEAQMLPVEYLKPCLAALEELVAHYGCTVVFCTATQPALDGIIEDLPRPVEISQARLDSFEKLRRVTYCLEGELDDARLAERLRNEKQVLCILDNRKQTRVVFESLDDDGTYHLSTLMHPEHRRTVISEIRQRLKEGLPCRVISTSLVEAGVDLDFPVVYRAMSGLDSIVQAAGRCNRNDGRSSSESLVHIFEPDDSYRRPREVSQRAAVGRSVLRSVGYADGGGGLIEIDLGSPEIMREYFARLYDIRRDGMDKGGAYKKLANDRGGWGSYPFKSVAEEFKLIESADCSVIVPSEAIEEEIELLREGVAGRNAMRRLRQYSVNVYRANLPSLAGSVEQVAEDTFLLVNTDRYSSACGLDLTDRHGEGLMW
ncbi:CRISPR-associated endonuclease Cas3'' [Adlercreutzia caecimuris]|uniref:CRISPR-associated endonuclease Cas3'' n=1 Tax=Adlercreutzia caecimuris TaxID=671266 RepID=UPI00272BC9DA|nr:CRISPR-associated endonuclease Cas3'' [Adlercreutzia caecimuris]